MPSHSLFSALSAMLLFSSSALAGYNLTDHYDHGNFFTQFDFFNSADPTHGFVEFANAQTANDQRLAGFVETGVYLGADHITPHPAGSGRQSTRVTSQKTWTHGLFITDIAHMPSSTCGLWPAYWLVGGNWPNQGEIDIIEGVHTATADTITLHTSAGCTITSAGSMPGTKLGNTDCNAGNADEGCSQTVAAANTYGDGFNAINGGVYATEWTSDSISVWFFPRSAIPADISASTPDTTGWGAPLARFNGGAGCTLDDHFKDHRIVFDITFCGDWAGKVWEQTPECTALAPTCDQYVAANPTAFSKAFFLVNYIQVYQKA